MDGRQRQRRITAVFILLLLFGVGLIFRLGMLQLWDGRNLAVQALEQRVQEVPVDIARGDIVDRNLIPLTNTSLHYSVVIFPTQVTDKAAVAAQLSPILGISREQIVADLHRHHRPFKLKTDIDAVTARQVENLRQPGVLAVEERMRYGYGGLAAHVVGYINASDNRGVSGIEAAFDRVLRGNRPEYVAAMVDAGQNLIPGLGYKRIKLEGHGGPTNVRLTLDARIQKKVELVLDRTMRRGAVVVMQPATGEILAMVSRPGFDANNLSLYLNRSDAPLLNRCISAFQPGSVFKLVVAAAALEEKIVKPYDVFFDPGYIDVDKLRFKGWDYDKGGRGRITFTDAMAYSSNPVFIQVGLKAGGERIINYARKMGLGQATDIGLDGEEEGNLPAPDALFPGDIANLSIGQGTVEVTPLQIAVLMSTIVNDGVRVPPRLVQQLISDRGIVVKKFPPAQGERVLSRETAATVKAMLLATTQYGTGQAAYVDGYGAAGKTGSAETGRVDEQGKSINHAWFAGYAPLKNPRYVIVVMVEEGMSGGDVAAPIFREIAEELLRN